jgi:hypothetical protein
LFGFIPSAGTFIPEAALNPAAGYRLSANGVLTNVGSYGYYWSSSPAGTNGSNLSFLSASVTPSSTATRGAGFSARCIAAFITVFYMVGIVDLRKEKRMVYKES